MDRSSCINTTQHLPRGLAGASPAAATMSSTALYVGTWTSEEKDYVAGLIEEFRAGNIPGLRDKSTLRAFIAHQLGCSEKRITKKYERTGYNGRLVYIRGAKDLTPEESQRRLQKLKELETKFRISRARLLSLRPPNYNRSPQQPAAPPAVSSNHDDPHRAAARQGLANPSEAPVLGKTVGLGGSTAARFPQSLGVSHMESALLRLQEQRLAAAAATKNTLPLSRQIRGVSPNLYMTSGDLMLDRLAAGMSSNPLRSTAASSAAFFPRSSPALGGVAAMTPARRALLRDMMAAPLDETDLLTSSLMTAQVPGAAMIGSGWSDYLLSRPSPHSALLSASSSSALTRELVGGSSMVPADRHPIEDVVARVRRQRSAAAGDLNSRPAKRARGP